MGCCDSKPEPPEDMALDHKTPRMEMVPIGKCNLPDNIILEEDEPPSPIEVTDDEDLEVALDFASMSTGKL